MKALSAPWRMEFILNSVKSSDKKKECPFCFSESVKPSLKNLILHKGKTAFVILNKYPYTNGHIMVIPNRHLSDFTKLKSNEHKEMGELMALSQKVMKDVLNPHGFNLGMNIGKIAGAGIAEHLHYHIVPRWEGDHNFMPVVSELRVIPEHFVKTYKKLRKGFLKFEKQNKAS